LRMQAKEVVIDLRSPSVPKGMPHPTFDL